MATESLAQRFYEERAALITVTARTLPPPTDAVSFHSRTEKGSASEDVLRESGLPLRGAFCVSYDSTFASTTKV